MARKPKTPTTLERRQEAENKVVELTAKVEALVLEKTATLLESPQPVVVPWHDYPTFDGFNGWGGVERPYYWSSIEDRQDGRYRPYYEDDMDLRRIRASGRRLKALFPVAEGALEAITNYTIKGLEVKVKPKKRVYENDPRIGVAAKFVQDVVDGFLEHNHFVDRMDREIHEDTRVDGEAFVTLYPDGPNLSRPDRVRIELVDPDYILEPLSARDKERWLGCSHKLNSWRHGVHTQYSQILKRDDVTRPLGYHAVFDKVGDQWDYLPAWRVEHIKRNVGSTARRGVSDFCIVLNDIEAEAKIRRNTAEGAAILAAIVMIREHAEGTSKASVERMVGTNATSNPTRYTPNGTVTTNNEQVHPGTIKDVPHGMVSRVGPLGELNSPVYMEVGQYVLRAIWQRWNAPEYMTGDASNANLASTLVAESPFVRAREADQAFYGSHFERIIWKALAMFQAFGKLRDYSVQQLHDLLTISVSLASPASRDLEKQARAYDIMHAAEVVSKRTWRMDAGFDPQEEDKQVAMEPKKAQPEVGTNTPFDNSSMPRLEALAAVALARITEVA